MTTAAQKAAANKAKAEAAAYLQKVAADRAKAKADAAAKAQELRRQGQELGDYNEYKKNLAALDSLKQRTRQSAEKNIQRYSKKHTQDETQQEIDRKNKLIQQAEDKYNNYQTYVNDRFGYTNDKYQAPQGVKTLSPAHKKELDFHMYSYYSRPKDIDRVKQQFQTWNGKAPTEAELPSLAKKYGIDYTPPPPPPPPAPKQTYTAPQYKPFQYAAPGSPSWQTDYGAQPEDYTEANYRNPYYTLPTSFTNAHPYNPGGYSEQQYQQYQDVQQDRFQPDIYANNKKGGLIKAKTTKSTSKPTSKVKSSKASSRGDGIAQRGKTRGTMR